MSIIPSRNKGLMGSVSGRFILLVLITVFFALSMWLPRVVFRSRTASPPILFARLDVSYDCSNNTVLVLSINNTGNLEIRIDYIEFNSTHIPVNYFLEPGSMVSIRIPLNSTKGTVVGRVYYSVSGKNAYRLFVVSLDHCGLER